MSTLVRQSQQVGCFSNVADHSSMSRRCLYFGQWKKWDKESWWLKLAWLFTLPLARSALRLLCSGSFLHKGERKMSPVSCLCAAPAAAVKVCHIISFQYSFLTGQFRVNKDHQVSWLIKVITGVSSGPLFQKVALEICFVALCSRWNHYI